MLFFNGYGGFFVNFLILIFFLFFSINNAYLFFSFFFEKFAFFGNLTRVLRPNLLKSSFRRRVLSQSNTTWYSKVGLQIKYNPIYTTNKVQIRCKYQFFIVGQTNVVVRLKHVIAERLWNFESYFIRSSSLTPIFLNYIFKTAKQVVILGDPCHVASKLTLSLLMALPAQHTSTCQLLTYACSVSYHQTDF